MLKLLTTTTQHPLTMYLVIANINIFINWIINWLITLITGQPFKGLWYYEVAEAYFLSRNGGNDHYFQVSISCLFSLKNCNFL